MIILWQYFSFLRENVIELQSQQSGMFAMWRLRSVWPATSLIGIYTVPLGLSYLHADSKDSWSDGTLA